MAAGREGDGMGPSLLHLCRGWWAAPLQGFGEPLSFHGPWATTLVLACPMPHGLYLVSVHCAQPFNNTVNGSPANFSAGYCTHSSTLFPTWWAHREALL